MMYMIYREPSQIFVAKITTSFNAEVKSRLRQISHNRRKRRAEESK